MPMINLLPWREELRLKRKKEFALAALGAVVMGAVLTAGTLFFYKAKIANQQFRNAELTAEIAILDEILAKIGDLEARKARLLDRMEIIERLERTTPEAVTLVDSLVNAMPKGTHLTGVAQQGTSIQLAGLSQSNARVSDLMRNVDKSEWLRNPLLDIVEGKGPTSEGTFRMVINQIRIDDNQEAL